MERFVDFHLHVENLTEYLVTSHHTPIWVPFLCLVHDHNNTQICQFEQVGENRLIFIKHLLNNIVGKVSCTCLSQYVLNVVRPYND